MSTTTTLGGQAVISNDMLVKGIIESISTVNQFYQLLPFKGIHGNALAYNRELVGQDQMDLVSSLDTGATSINKDSQRFSRHSTELTTIIGDAQVNGLVQAVGSDFHDATAIQVAAKAKGLGRHYMNMMINGTAVLGGSNHLSGTPVVTDVSNLILDLYTALSKRSITTYSVNGVDKAVTLANLQADISAKTSTTAIESLFGIDTKTVAFTSAGTYAGGSLTLTATGVTVYNLVQDIIHGYVGFDGLDALVTQDDIGSSSAIATSAAGDYFTALDTMIDQVRDKDGMVDYIMMHSRGVRQFTAMLRSVSAAGYDDVMEIKMSSGGVMKVQSYRGIPIFRNDFVQATAGAANHVYVGTLDDGTFTHGISGLTASKSSGMQVQKIGARENVDADITRVKWYCGLASFSELGLVRGSV
jgi:hypothetical protein